MQYIKVRIGELVEVKKRINNRQRQAAIQNLENFVNNTGSAYGCWFYSLHGKRMDLYEVYSYSTLMLRIRKFKNGKLRLMVHNDAKYSPTTSRLQGDIRGALWQLGLWYPEGKEGITPEEDSKRFWQEWERKYGIKESA